MAFCTRSSNNVVPDCGTSFISLFNSNRNFCATSCFSFAFEFNNLPSAIADFKSGSFLPGNSSRKFASTTISFLKSKVCSNLSVQNFCCSNFNSCSNSSASFSLRAKAITRTSVEILSAWIFECNTTPSNEVQRLKATYTWPAAKEEPASSMAFWKVRPWLLWMVMAHARRIGNCIKDPISSSSIASFSRS